MLATISITRAGHHGRVSSKIACYLSLKSQGEYVRGYAGVAAPVMNASADKGMDNMWASYNVALKDAVFKGNGKKFDTSSSKFFTPVMGTIGIPAGSNVPEPITNFGVASIANTLLPPDSPVFTPGSETLTGRLENYLAAVQLKKNTSPGAKSRLDTAEKKQADLQAKFDDLTTKARAGFAADTDKAANLPFRMWVGRNYPQYDSLQSELQQAAGAANSAMIDFYGPGIGVLNRYKTNVEHAQDSTAPWPGLNMPVSEQQANTADGTTLDPNVPPEFRPAFTIQGGYTDMVKSWIADADSASGTAKPTNIEFGSSSSSNKSFSESGFSNTGVSIGASYGFLAVRTSTDVSTQSSHLNAELFQQGISATMTTRGLASFDIKPGSWYEDFMTIYPPSSTSFLADFKFPEAYAVSQIVMGYNVSMKFKISAADSHVLQDFYKQHISTGVDVSIMGIPVSIGAHHEEGKQQQSYSAEFKDNFQTIEIAGNDNLYPVVLGVVGRRLPGITKPRTS